MKNLLSFIWKWLARPPDQPWVSKGSYIASSAALPPPSPPRPRRAVGTIKPNPEDAG